MSDCNLTFGMTAELMRNKIIELIEKEFSREDDNMQTVSQIIYKAKISLYSSMLVFEISQQMKDKIIKSFKDNDNVISIEEVNGLETYISRDNILCISFKEY